MRVNTSSLISPQNEVLTHKLYLCEDLSFSPPNVRFIGSRKRGVEKSSIFSLAYGYN
jgi:hypothetical protein